MTLVYRVALAAAVAAVACLPGVSAAAEEGDSQVSWAFRPAGPEGADKRSWIELTLDPGDSAVEHAELVNLSSREVTFQVQAADGYFTDQGRFTILPASRESTEAGLWIDAPGAVTVAAGESVVIPFTVTAPANATPGDHPAGLAASVLQAGSDSEGNGVSVDSRVGFRVMTRVAGAFLSGIDLDVGTRYAGRWNPFEPGSATVDYTVANTGNTRLKLTLSGQTAGPFGLGAKTWQEEMAGELAPGETRTGSFTARGVWPLLWLTGRVDVDAEPAVDTGEAPFRESGAAGAAAVPWPQLAVLAVAAGLVAQWLGSKAKARRDTDRRLAEAVERGRREAQAELKEGDSSADPKGRPAAARGGGPPDQPGADG